jgi:hypothetical protein
VDFLLKPVCPAELRGAIDSVMKPGDDPLSRAMAEARAGRLDEAVGVLESGTDGTVRIDSWLRIMRSLRRASLDGEAAAFAQLEREGLGHLAYQLPAE